MNPLLMSIQPGLTLASTGTVLPSLVPSAAMRLLEDVFTQEMGASRLQALLQGVLHDFEHYTREATETMSPQVERLMGPTQLIRTALDRGDVELQRQTLNLLASPSRTSLRYPLIHSVAKLAELAGQGERVEELRAATPGNNPIPWWYSRMIPTGHGALAVGGIEALDWLIAIRDAVEAGEIPPGMGREPHLLWIPEKLYQAVYLNKTGKIFSPDGKESLVINRPGQLRIKALAPLLRQHDYLIISNKETMALPRVFARYGGKPTLLHVVLRSKYEVHREAEQIDEGTLRLSDNKLRRLEPHESLYSPSKGQGTKIARWVAMTRWALERFQHVIVLGNSPVVKELLRSESFKSFPNRLLSYDFQGMPVGAIPTYGVWQGLEGNSRVRIFFRDDRFKTRDKGDPTWMAVMDGFMPRRTSETPPPDVAGYLGVVTSRLREIQMLRYKQQLQKPELLRKE